MNQDSDLELGDIGEVPVDEQPARPGGGRPGGGGKPPRGGSPRGERQPPRGSGSGGGLSGNFWMFAALGMLALVLIGGSFLYREVTSLRMELDEELARSTDQLSRLSRELSATDETLLESWDKIEDRLDFQMSEIRKLWAVSNERNRDWIEKNQESIKTLRSQREQISSSLETMENRLSATRDELSGVRDAVEQARLAQNQMETRVGIVRESMSELEADVQARMESVALLEDVLPQLEALAETQREGGGLASRLGEIEEAIAAFDSYRRQVNTRLDRLERD